MSERESVRLVVHAFDAPWIHDAALDLLELPSFLHGAAVVPCALRNRDTRRSQSGCSQRDCQGDSLADSCAIDGHSSTPRSECTFVVQVEGPRPEHPRLDGIRYWTGTKRGIQG